MTNGSQELEKRIDNMGTALDHPQYDEVILDEDGEYTQVGRDMLALIQRAATNELELSEKTLDYTVELMGRHGLTAEEVELLAGGDIATMTAEQAETVTRRLHVALEVINYEVAPGAGTVREVAQEQMAQAIAIANSVRVVEELGGEEVDELGLLIMAEAFRTYLMTSGNADKISEQGSLQDLVDAEDRTVAKFIVKRYGSDQSDN